MWILQWNSVYTENISCLNVLKNIKYQQKFWKVGAKVVVPIKNVICWKKSIGAELKKWIK